MPDACLKGVGAGVDTRYYNGPDKPGMKRRSHNSWWNLLLAVTAAAALCGCGSAPVRPYHAERELSAPDSTSTAPGARAVYAAYRQLGTPYRYGGSTPDGFDCSGLIQYAYHRAGIDIPRTTRQQLRHARPVSLSALRPGDLVFFRVSRRKVSHVGIYAGGGRFIHAPSSGKQVSYADLNDPFWHRRIIAVGRIY